MYQLSLQIEKWFLEISSFSILQFMRRSSKILLRQHKLRNFAKRNTGSYQKSNLHVLHTGCPNQRNPINDYTIHSVQYYVKSLICYNMISAVETRQELCQVIDWNTHEQ